MSKKIDNDDDFFGDILGDEDNKDNLFEKTDIIEDEPHFSFEDEDEDTDTEDDTEDNTSEEVVPNSNYEQVDHYDRTKSDIKDSVAELQGNINSMLNTINTKPEDMFPDKDLLPSLDLQVEYHDYDKDIELIKIESKETLESLANLYLTEDQMKTKNIYKIIKDDSKSLSKLNFSIEQTQRALISCMKQLDMGVNDPLMYQSVAMFQKELRDTVKMAYDLQKKMKDFYKELKSELLEINAGEEEVFTQEDNYTVIGDPKLLNDLFEKMKTDPTLLGDMIKHQKDK